MLSIVTTPGRILLQEFCLLMYLVNLKLIRKELSQRKYEEIASEVLRVSRGPVNASGGYTTAKLSSNPPSVGGSANSDVAYFWIRKSSIDCATAKIMPKISAHTFRPTQRIRCVDTYQTRSSMDPIKLPPAVRQDLNQRGTQGSVLFVLEGVEGMTCQIENWLSFCGNFPRLRVYLAVAQYEHSKYLRRCPPGIWTPPCQRYPHRRFALW